MKDEREDESCMSYTFFEKWLEFWFYRLEFAQNVAKLGDGLNKSPIVMVLDDNNLIKIGAYLSG